MSSIMDLAKTEAMLFKVRFGRGFEPVDHSIEQGEDVGGGTLRSVSFMRGLRRLRRVVKSGAKTRRAAKMVILDVTTPTSRTSSTASSARRRRPGP